MVVTNQTTTPEPSVARRWKRGDVGPDGRVFMNYAPGYKNGEYWVTAEKFANHCEHLRKYRSGRVDKMRESSRLSMRKRYAERREFAIAEVRKYRANHPDRVIQANRRYYASNAEECRKRACLYAKSNRDKRNTYATKYYSEPIKRLCRNTRSRIRGWMREAGFKKTSKAQTYVGCSWDFLRAHLEAQFQPGMTWENYGEWHVDHIVPLASAKSEADVMRLCHYSNLQPLWAFDNISKGAKLIHAQ